MDEIQPAVIQMPNIGNASLNISVCSLESRGNSQICLNVATTLVLKPTMGAQEAAWEDVVCL